MAGFRPLLSPQDDPLKNPDFFKRIQAALPLMLSPKYDGIRGVVRGQVMSRTYKALPSIQVQKEFSAHALPSILGYDGELIEGCETDPDVYNRTQSHVMSVDKPGYLSFFVVDNTHDEVIHLPFYRRVETLYSTTNVIVVEHTIVDTLDELLAYEEEKLKLGFEGIMMRDPVGRYKNGRATFNEGIIFKLKRFEDAEGLVIGVEEALQNLNVQERDELGFSKRSDTKDAKRGTGRVGRFLIQFEDDQFPEALVLKVAPGTYKHEQLREIWENPSLVLKKIMKFRFMRTGSKDMPRHPRALGLRDPSDM